MTAYETPGCAYCPSTVRACRVGEGDVRGPGYCPSKIEPDAILEADAYRSDRFIERVAKVSAVVESEGYCKWTRVEEICQFARKMGFKRVGIATCISFVDLSRVFSAILESHGLEVASVACKNGGVPKEEIGLKDEEKIRPGTFEAICNPLSQAELLNRAGCELNVIVGLCVGHDSLFIRHSQGLVTTLVTKDRVLAHNPVGALQLADTYYSRVWGPDKPARLPTKPVSGRAKPADGSRAEPAAAPSAAASATSRAPGADA